MNKYKFITEREPVSSGEIAGRRNFQNILKSVKKTPVYKQPLFLAGIAAGIVLVAAVTLFFSLKKNINLSSELTEKTSQIIAPDFEIKKTIAITAPMPEVNFAYQVFEAGNDEETNWKSERGSSVYIPEKSLVDKNGNLIKGKVEIRFREFHDPVDFFLSGIPMTYDSGGIKYVFESAGMVEILAFQDGKPVFVHPEKKATINLVSAQEGNRYNLYQYDTALGNWVIKGKDKLTIINPPRSTSGSNRQETEIAQEPEIAEKQNIAKKEIIKLEKQKPEEPRKVSKEKEYIELGMDTKEFPELAMYKDVKFEVGKENKNYNPKDVSAFVWDGAKLSTAGIKGSYLLTLKKGKKELTYIVYPALDGQDYEQAQKKFEAQYKDYQQALEKRREDLQKIDEMIKEEQQRRKENMERFIASSNGIGAKVQRTFQIAGFGIFNCDAPWLNRMPEYVQAQFTDNNGSNISLRELYLVEKGRNAIISLKANQNTTINYNPKAENMIWGVTDENKLALVQQKDINILSSSPRNITFNMQIINEPIRTAEDVRKYIKI